MILPNFPSFKNFFLVFSFFLPFYTSKTSCRFALLLPVSQWVYDKSRVRLSLHLQRPRSLIRVIRDIRVPLTIQAAEPTGFIRAIRVPLTYTSSRDNRPYSCDSRYSCSFKSPATETSVSHSHSFEILLPVDQWVYDKSRVRLPYTNFSPLFICTSFTNFLTSADESSFLHINSTLSSSATI